MRTRFVWLALGLTFCGTLAVVVGQRLSAEAMAVFVGVVAGIVASIPTSLIVVWLALRLTTVRSGSASPPVIETRPAEPRIVLVSPTMAAMQAGYSAALPAVSPPYAPGPRRFTVIGGAETTYGDLSENEEVIWRP